MIETLLMAFRYAGELVRFLRTPFQAETSRDLLVQNLRHREDSFLNVVERGIYSNPKSPYLALLRWAKVELPDVQQLVRQLGIETTLERLYDAGVYLTIDEFKGRKPIVRTGLELQYTSKDFDNPLSTKHLEATTGGSTRGIGSRVSIDLDKLTNEVACDYFNFSPFDLSRRPTALWRIAPPGVAGIRIVLRLAKLGISAERWFSQSKVRPRLGSLKYYAFTMYTVAASRLVGRPVPMPEYMPLQNALSIAKWLAQKKARGTPAHFDTNVGSAIRVCLAAQQHGLDISGTIFHIGGESYTEAKARVINERGARALCRYSMAEVGMMGAPCTNPEAPDEVHVLQDSLAIIQREKRISSTTIGALVNTTLQPNMPKLMLNVETGDFGTLTKRNCGCPMEQMGFTQHLSHIHSFEKLTTDGMNFLGSELVKLIEEVLPARYGGNPTDYQFVEEANRDGLDKVSLVISPRVGAIDEANVVATVLQTLGSPSKADTMMATFWRDGRTVRVLRREPYATSAAKILPLHFLREH